MEKNDLFDLKEEVYHLRDTLEKQLAAKDAPPKPKHATEMTKEEYAAACKSLGLGNRKLY